MNLFEILKAKHGILTSDLKTMLWRNNANPSEYDVTITNTPPLYLPYSLGYNLTDWSITGQTVQDGTPTPENPVDVQGVGDWDETTQKYKIPVVTRGKNLTQFPYTSKLYLTGSGQNRTVKETTKELSNIVKLKPNTTYTLSGKRTQAGDRFGRIGLFDTEITVGATTTRFLYFSGDGYVTFTTSATEIYALQFTGFQDAEINFYNQLELGSTATQYESYTEPTTTNIYLDSQLMTGETVSSDGTVRRADGTIETITPPQIPTTTGTCVLDVDTSVQPSSMTVTYKSSVPDNDMADMIQLLSEI